MNGVLIAFIVVLIVPLFVATWRTSLLGLSLQGALMAWIFFHHGGHVALTADNAVTFVDLIVLRTVAGPLLLYFALRQQNAPRRNDVIAPNLFSWGIALVLVLMSFRIGDVLVPIEGDHRTLVAVATSSVLLGLLVLSTRSGPFSQMVGALRLENGIALFELGQPEHQEQIGIRIAQTVVFAFTVAFFRWYLVQLHADKTAPPVPEKTFL